MSESFSLNLIIFILAPFIGALIMGVERILRARMQNRVGPPLLQPFYDLFKLASKRSMIVHSYHAVLGIAYFFVEWIALGMLLFGEDLIMVIFFKLLASSMLFYGAYSSRSVFSQMGANRELIAILAYEPILVFSSIGLFFVTGSFLTSGIAQYDGIALFWLPLIFIAFFIASLIKLGKSPFDIAEAHQEIAGGAEIEYSGIFYEAVYGAKWLNYVFIYGFLYLFSSGSFLFFIVLSLLFFVASNLIDNSTARVNYKQMLWIVGILGFGLSIINLLVL
ncbi:MAG: complex I subunit 1 family protein [Campylobacterales bacterium]